MAGYFPPSAKQTAQTRPIRYSARETLPYDTRPCIILLIDIQLEANGTSIFIRYDLSMRIHYNYPIDSIMRQQFSLATSNYIPH